MPSGGLGSGLALIVARLIVGVHGTAATGVGFLGTLMVMEWGRVFFGVGPSKGVGLQGQGVGAGMSGVRLVGALGRDETYVSAEISRTGEVMVGEGMVLRDQCPVRELEMGETGAISGGP